jgi:hypothetical protein
MIESTAWSSFSVIELGFKPMVESTAWSSFSVIELGFSQWSKA